MSSQPIMTTPEIPIACLLGDGAARDERLREVERLFRRTTDVEDTADGYSFHFTGEDEIVEQLGTFIAEEQRCCPFLMFELRVAPAAGKVTLRLGGGEGVKEFIAATFIDPTR